MDIRIIRERYRSIILSFIVLIIIIIIISYQWIRFYKEYIIIMSDIYEPILLIVFIIIFLFIAYFIWNINNDNNNTSDSIIIYSLPLPPNMIHKEFIILDSYLDKEEENL